MSATAAGWIEANQRHLAASVAVVRARLQALVEGADELDAALEERAAAAQDLPGAPALTGLGLTPFERDVLVGAAAAELDADVARLCAQAQGDPRRNQLTFALAQALFEDAHWSALTPARPLRALRLIELGPGPLPSCPLTISERVLHHLLGLDALEERLQPWLAPLPPPAPLPESQRAAVERLAELWSQPLPPLVQVVGPRASDRRHVIAAAAAECGRVPWVVSELSGDRVERDGWWRLVQRELLLDGIVLAVEDVPVVDWVAGAVALSGEASAKVDRPSVIVSVPRPSADEQRALWQHGLGRLDVGDVAQAFDLGSAEIFRIAATHPDDLRDACRRETRPALDGLAQRVISAAGWDDLVLPEEALDGVRTIAAHAPHRLAVAEAFGAGARGQGLIALFAGASGTGKTLAAEVIANELGLDLFRVDLSAVVSK